MSASLKLGANLDRFQFQTKEIGKKIKKMLKKFTLDEVKGNLWIRLCRFCHQNALC